MIENVGTIIKNYNGYYYVALSNKTVACKLRGRLKKEKFSILTGDRVQISLNEDKSEGNIEQVLSRKNRLIKPAVANIDQIVLVFSLKNPDYKQNIVDRFLVLASQADIPIIICFNKVDLSDIKSCKNIAQIYEQIGYEVLFVSVLTGEGLDGLTAKLHNKITVFAGLSGVGKSSILNYLNPEFSLATGEVSEKNNKGRHTTRYSQLIGFDGGYIIDTPGYALNEFTDFSKEQVSSAFKEFDKYKNDCRFNGCNHLLEPSCAVKMAVEKNIIDKNRYQNYCDIISDLKERKYK